MVSVQNYYVLEPGICFFCTAFRGKQKDFYSYRMKGKSWFELTAWMDFLTWLQHQDEEKGFSYYQLGKMEEQKQLKRINKSTYENLLYQGEENDFINVSPYIPSGVVCLLSAARYYRLTSFLPDSVDIAIDRKKKVSTLPFWPIVHLYYFQSSRMEIGVEEKSVGKDSFRIFDKEKTVADILYYRNKVGIEETAEILRNYLKSSERNIDLLYRYARSLHCETILKTYMEVLLV